MPGKIYSEGKSSGIFNPVFDSISIKKVIVFRTSCSCSLSPIWVLPSLDNLAHDIQLILRLLFLQLSSYVQNQGIWGCPTATTINNHAQSCTVSLNCSWPGNETSNLKYTTVQSRIMVTNQILASGPLLSTK